MTLTQLFPTQHQTPLKGAYLTEDIRNKSTGARPYIYTNFVTSIDGRIAIPHPTKAGYITPPTIANERDWRLFQELAAQADIIIASGRYLRDWTDDPAHEILQVNMPQYADLKAWRTDRGLPPFADLAIVSGALNFDIPPVLVEAGRNVVIFTSAQADTESIAKLEAQGGKVVVAGEQLVDGEKMASELHNLGYKVVYSAAGGRTLHMLLSAGVVNRLYLSLAQRIVGGNPFAPIVEGSVLENSTDLQLTQLYYDAIALDGCGQLLATYNILNP